MTYQQLQIYKVLQNALSQISRTNDPTFQINCLSVEKKVNIILFNYLFENAYNYNDQSILSFGKLDLLSLIRMKFSAFFFNPTSTQSSVLVTE